MDFSNSFVQKENLSLDKNTLTILRYIAIIGQILAISIVFYYLNLPFPIIESYLIVSLGLATNLYLQFAIKINQLKDFYTAPFLLIDLIQLSALLYLTGGIFNPFFSISDPSHCFLNISKYGHNNYFRFNNIIAFINHIIFSFTFARREYGFVTFSKFL